MFRPFFITLLVLNFSLQASELMQARRVETTGMRERWITPLQLEHATTSEELQWGLMQRTVLPPNAGMVFTFPAPDRLHFWAFNVLIDLSLAYLDTNRVIREVHDLPAYPEAMDPARPVNTINDLDLYPIDDPVLRFYSERRVSSSFPAQYALEVNKSWFSSHDVRAGDLVLWQRENEPAFIVHTVSVDEIIPTDEMPAMLEFPGQYPHAVWMPESSAVREVVFYDQDLNPLSHQTLHGGGNRPVAFKQVVYSLEPVKYILIATEGWFDRRNLTRSTTVDAAFEDL